MNRVTRCICSPTPHVWRPVYVCAVYLSVLESVPFTEKIKFSSTNMWWIYTGVEFERSQRFLFFFGISIWTMHHQLAKRAVIVVIICLSEECFQHNQCFNQWSPLAPAKYIFYRATKRRLYLIRKSGGKKPGLWHFLGSYILYHQSFATWRNWKTWAFSCINLTTNMFRVCKNYLSSGICHHF